MVYFSSRSWPLFQLLYTNKGEVSQALEDTSQVLGNHYYEHIYAEQTYYIVLKHIYNVLYGADFREIIDSQFAADKIIPLKDVNRQNQLIIIKGNQKGIYYIDHDSIRWGYKGCVDRKININNCNIKKED